MKISIIIPCYNNEGSIDPLMNRMFIIEKNEIFNNSTFEYVFVDDGSQDNTYNSILKLKKESKSFIKAIKLTRNFGSYNSFLAGMYHASGDCIVHLHADLQDPPELIPDLFLNYLKGFELVIANRSSRDDESFFSTLYHNLVKKYAIRNIPTGGFDLIMFSHNIKNHIINISEKNTNNVYLISWLGFPYVSIPYKRERREHGNSQWAFNKKVKLFIDTIFSFTNVPVWIVRGLLTFSILLFLISILFYFLEESISLNFILASFFSSLLLTGIMIIVEYLDRIHETIRKRPNFIVEKIE